MKVDPDKQFVDEDIEVYKPNFETKEEDEVYSVESKDLTQYGLVATKAKNGIVLLWEWMPLEEARITAQKIFEDL